MMVFILRQLFRIRWLHRLFYRVVAWHDRVRDQRMIWARRRELDRAGAAVGMTAYQIEQCIKELERKTKGWNEQTLR